MDPKKHPSFHMYLTEIGREANLRNEVVSQIIENYFEELEIFRTPDPAERVKIKRTKDGEITVATSLKIPNVRFQIGKLVYRMAGKGFSITGAHEDPIRIAYFIIGFFIDVFELSSLPLMAQDAKVLAGIFALANTCNQTYIRVDQVVEYFQKELTAKQISDSLAELNRIWCIELSMDGMRLIESVVIQSA